MNKLSALQQGIINRPASHSAGAAVLLAAFLLLLGSCSSSRKTAGEGAVKARTPEYLVKQMITGQVDAEWMDARAKVNYDDGYMSIGATADIRLRRDSVLWVAVRKLGFEVGRVLITPDSVYLVDRINNEYLIRDLSYFTDRYNVPADFGVLQAIILGNPFFLMTPDLEASAEAPQYHLFGQRGSMESHYWIDGKDYRLQRMALNDKGSERKVEVSYEDYGQAKEDEKFSYLRNLKLESRETGQMSVGIRFSEVEFNVPKNIRFEIPDRYTRVD